MRVLEVDEIEDIDGCIDEGIEVEVSRPNIDYDSTASDPALVVIKPEIPLLATLSEKEASSVIDCPLNALNQPRLIRMIKDSITDVVSFSAYK